MRKFRFFATCTVVLAFAAAASLHAQNYSVLYNFGSKSGDPGEPLYSGIIAQGRDGNLYSTAPFGGANGFGAVFKFTPAQRSVTPLYSFTGGTDGGYNGAPQGGLTLGTDGNFYGTTAYYGASGYGTVFVTQSGSLTSLYHFTDGNRWSNSRCPTSTRHGWELLWHNHQLQCNTSRLWHSI